jgi:hypothetical protein
VRRHPTLTAPWCLGGAGPESHPGNAHTTDQGAGAVAPLTGPTHYRISPVWGKDACAPCARQLPRDSRDQSLRGIHDGAEQPRGAGVEAVLPEAASCRLRTPPPASSLALPPEERIWKWMRCVGTHHRGLASLPDERQALRDFVDSLAGHQEEGRRLCALQIPESGVALL